MRRAIVMMAAAAMVLAACSSDSTETTTTAASAGGIESTTTAGSDAPTTTTEPPADTTTTAAAEAGGGITECVVGVWELDSAGFFEVVMAEVEATEEGEFEFIGGAYILSINDDGTFTNERRDWTFGFVSDMGDFQVRINHIQNGTWSIDGTMLTTVSGASEAPTIEFLLDGVPFEFPGGASPIAPPEAEFQGATVACDGDTLSATFAGLTSSWSRT